MSLRLFQSIRPPPAEMRPALIMAMHGVPGARWQSDAQFHLTLAFVGAVKAARVAALVDALDQVPFAPFQIVLTGFSEFAPKGRAKSIHAAANGGAALASFHEDTWRAGEAAGLTCAERRFAPTSPSPR